MFLHRKIQIIINYKLQVTLVKSRKNLTFNSFTFNSPVSKRVWRFPSINFAASLRVDASQFGKVQTIFSDKVISSIFFLSTYEMDQDNQTFNFTYQISLERILNVEYEKTNEFWFLLTTKLTVIDELVLTRNNLRLREVTAHACLNYFNPFPIKINLPYQAK